MKMVVPIVAASAIGPNVVGWKFELAFDLSVPDLAVLVECFSLSFSFQPGQPAWAHILS